MLRGREVTLGYMHNNLMSGSAVHEVCCITALETLS